MQLSLNRESVPFNLDYTLDCGQVFRWSKKGEYWYGTVEDTVIKLKQENDKLIFETYPKRINVDFIQQYFRLDDDLPRIVAEINKDVVVRRAIMSLHGLRIIRQDPWECLISYICATFSNIPRIKGMVLNLSQKFGKKIRYDELTFYTFPSRETLAKATLKELMDCGLGFRAKYVQETARTIRDLGFEKQNMGRLTYVEAREWLLALAGVGPKVADCILLFSLDKLEAFPVDVWIRRIILKNYNQYFSDVRIFNKSLTVGCYDQIGAFGRSYFGKHAGYAQEYLFHFYRLHNNLI